MHFKEAAQSVIGAANQAGESIYVVDLNTSNSNTSQMNQTSAQVLGVAGGGGSTFGSDAFSAVFTGTRQLGYLSHLDNANYNDDMKSLAGDTGAVTSRTINCRSRWPRFFRT